MIGLAFGLWSFGASAVLSGWSGDMVGSLVFTGIISSLISIPPTISGMLSQNFKTYILWILNNVHCVRNAEPHDPRSKQTVSFKLHYVMPESETLKHYTL